MKFRFLGLAFSPLMMFFASAAQPAPPTLEQKILDSVAEVSAVGASIAARFGHANVTNLVAAIPSMAVVIAGLIDSIRGLFAHQKAVTGAGAGSGTGSGAAAS